MTHVLSCVRSLAPARDEGTVRRCFAGWANHIRDLSKRRWQVQVTQEQERARQVRKQQAQHGYEMQAMLAREKAGQEEGKVRYYRAAARRTQLRVRFFQWVELLYQRRIVTVENLLQVQTSLDLTLPLM